MRACFATLAPSRLHPLRRAELLGGVLEVQPRPSRSAFDSVTSSVFASSSRNAFSSSVNHTVTSFIGLLTYGTHASDHRI